MVIVILGLLGVTVAIKWPQGMEQEAAVLEFTRAVRFAQHVAMTRSFESSTRAWGISIQGNKYTIERADSSETVAVPGIIDDPVGSRTYPLLKNVSITAASVYFNGYGEPIDTTTGSPLTATVTFRIGSDSIPVSVCRETGYVLRGAACP
ncbi:MAG: hypothetical protein L3J03_10460 [Desulfobacterales bacterium]|nr:hypothetical protein [Desulfobacterales bacterium]